MELTDEFEVPLAVPEAWAVLTDLERIAPCLPGAKLEEVVDGEYHGVVRVKVGPITVEYRGIATFVELDEPRRVVLKASGRETRGQGNAQAMVTAELFESGSATRVSVSTELDITGRVAQFGRGALADVSSKLLGQFVSNLESDLVATPVGNRDDVAPIDGTTPADEVAEEAPAERSSVEHNGTHPPRAEHAPGSSVSAPEMVEPLNLLRVAGVPVAKRVAPVAAVALVALLIGVRRRRRRGAA